MRGLPERGGGRRRVRAMGLLWAGSDGCSSEKWRRARVAFRSAKGRVFRPGVAFRLGRGPPFAERKATLGRCRGKDFFWWDILGHFGHPRPHPSSFPGGAWERVGWPNIFVFFV